MSSPLQILQLDFLPFFRLPFIPDFSSNLDHDLFNLSARPLTQQQILQDESAFVKATITYPPAETDSHSTANPASDSLQATSTSAKADLSSLAEKSAGQEQRHPVSDSLQPTSSSTKVDLSSLAEKSAGQEQKGGEKDHKSDEEEKEKDEDQPAELLEQEKYKYEIEATHYVNGRFVKVTKEVELSSAQNPPSLSLLKHRAIEMFYTPQNAPELHMKIGEHFLAGKGNVLRWYPRYLDQEVTAKKKVKTVKIDVYPDFAQECEEDRRRILKKLTEEDEENFAQNKKIR